MNIGNHHDSLEYLVLFQEVLQLIFYASQRPRLAPTI